MKKRFVKILSLIVAMLIGVGATGCNLITTNTDKDMNRVVATVNVTREEKITKRDMVMQYMNYGYYYVNYYGYTVERVYEMILDSMLQNKILVQHVESLFGANPDKFGVKEDESKVGVERFLKVDEENGVNDIIESEYNAYKAVNDLLDSYTHDHENDHDTKKDTIIGEVRTTPTGAANEVYELTLAEKKAYVNKYKTEGFDIKSTAERRKAYNEVVDVLDSYSLLGDFNGDLAKSTYFFDNLKNNQESLMIKYYEDYLRDSIVKTLSYENDIKPLYAEKYNAQTEMSNEEFVTALGSASATEPILVHNNGTYGYVYNILLGASTKQTDDIAKIKTDNKNITNEDFAKKRAEILEDTSIKDLRSSWIQSGYDFDGTCFTGDFTLVKDPANSLSFKGTVVKVKNEVKDEFGIVTEKAKYGVTKVEEYNLAEFMEMVENYVGAPVADAKSAYAGLEFPEHDVPYAKSFSGEIIEYDAKMEELLFAFSTDPGSLNKYKGYLIKPPVDGADNEEFVKTFGDAGRALIHDCSIKKTPGYVVVASDYGYHLMFYSEVLDVDYNYATLDSYLDTLNIDKPVGQTWEEYFNLKLADWDEFSEENNYLFYLANSLVENKINNEVDSTRDGILDRYLYVEEGAVVVDDDVYASLLG